MKKRTQDNFTLGAFLKDISFDIELLRNDKINVHYILVLIKDAVQEPSREKRRKTFDDIEKIIAGGTDPELYLKSDLIYGFIESIATEMDPDADFEDEYNKYTKSGFI